MRQNELNRTLAQITNPIKKNDPMMLRMKLIHFSMICHAAKLPKQLPLNNHVIQWHPQSDVKRESNPQRHGYVQTGV